MPQTQIKFFVGGNCVAMPKKIINNRGGYPRLVERMIKDTVTGKKYNPAISWREQINLYAKMAPESFLIDSKVPVEVLTWIVINKPKSVKNRIAPVVKPDLDNFTYLPHNCLEGVLYENDSQICHQDEWKVYADDVVNAGMFCQIRIIEPHEFAEEMLNIRNLFS